MPLKKNTVNIGTIPRFKTGKQLDIWDNSPLALDSIKLMEVVKKPNSCGHVRKQGGGSPQLNRFFFLKGEKDFHMTAGSVIV